MGSDSVKGSTPLNLFFVGIMVLQAKYTLLTLLVFFATGS
jgi:cytochrome c oxidase subunit IV